MTDYFCVKDCYEVEYKHGNMLRNDSLTWQVRMNNMFYEKSPKAFSDPTWYRDIKKQLYLLDFYC